MRGLAQRNDRDYCREQVMRHDRDRFRTVLFAPALARDDLCVLYAFNLEVARIRESVSEPTLGAIRLQWWRDTLDGAFRGETRRHAVAEPLAELIGRHRPSRAPFDRLLDARARDMNDDGFETLAAMTAYAEDTAGTLLELALAVLGASGDAAEAAARNMGAAWALTGLLRALPHRLRQGRDTLPQDLVARYGVSQRTLRAFRADEPARAAIAEIVAVAAGRLGEARTAARSIASDARTPLLLAPLADIHLRRLRRAEYDVFDPRVVAPAPFALARMAWRQFRGGI